MKNNSMIKLSKEHRVAAVPANSTQACKPQRLGRCGVRPFGLALLLGLMTAGLSSWADTRTWSAGANAYWDNPATWVEAAVPTASDDVTMNLVSWLNITNAAVANSILMNVLGSSSAVQYLQIINDGGVTGSGSLVVGGGAGAIGSGGLTTYNNSLYIRNSVQANVGGILSAGSVSLRNTTLANTLASGTGAPGYLTTAVPIYSHVQLLLGDSDPANNVVFHQTGGTISSPNQGIEGTGYGITLGIIQSYGVAGPTANISYYLDGGTLQAGRIGCGNGDGDNVSSARWIAHGTLYWNDGTIQPYNTSLIFGNARGYRNYDGTVNTTKDMQLATHNPFTISLAASGNHGFSATMGAGGYADIIVTPSAQIVGAGSIVYDCPVGVAKSLIFCGDNPLATNSFSGTTTVNGGELVTDFGWAAGQAASPIGTNVLMDAFSTNSHVILNGGNYRLKGRINFAGKTFTGKTLDTGGIGLNLLSANANWGVAGVYVTNSLLPAGTYVRRVRSNQFGQLNQLATGATGNQSWTSQTISLAPANFICTQHLAAVTLQVDSTLFVQPNLAGGPSCGATLVCGPIDGPGALTLDSGNGSGFLQLTGTNTYSGATKINTGTMLVGPNSWMSNSPSFTVSSGQALDGTAISGGIAVGASQTLLGRGSVRGATTINGTFKPGSSDTDIKTFSFNNNLTLAGTTVMELNKDLVGQTNDLATGITTLQYGGTLTVNNVGATPLAIGDSFKLFSAADHTGSFALTNLPVLAEGVWSWNPANGTLSVVSSVPSTPTNITYSFSGSTLELTWPGSYLGWYAQSNAVSLMDSNSWFDIPGSQNATNLSITVNPAQPDVFYRMRKP
jgi:autotransporter-associated beta strand protein